MMKRTLSTIISLAITTCMMAQSYSAMWKQVETANQKDLPKDKLQLLDKISKKAESEKQYGHLLKAMLMTVETATSISPDSTDAQIQRLEQRSQTINDSVAKAVMRSALGRTYKFKAQNTADKNEKKAYEEKSRAYYNMSLADADLLASVKAETYKPFIIEEEYSRIFDNDLLHVLGYEAKEYKLLHDFYAAKGNRHAECITALEMLRMQPSPGYRTEVKKSKYLQSVDSLINLYGDLKTGGALAVERYRCLENSQDATAAEKVQYINYALSRWGSWPGLNHLRNAKTELERPAFNINAGEKMMLPEVARNLRVNSIRNISQLDMAVYRLSLSGDTNLDPNNEKDIVQIKKHIVGTVVCTDQLRYFGKAPYEEFADSMTIAPLPVGMYLLEVHTDNKAIATQRCLLHVTNLFTMSQILSDKNLRIAVVNATTGKPVAGAKVRLCTGRRWAHENKTLATVTTGKNGDVVYQYDKTKPNAAYVYTDNDKASAEVPLDSFFPSFTRGEQDRTTINTDRSLYRPGQKVHVSAISWKTNILNMKAVPNVGKTMTISLINANYEEVQKAEVVTDEFGQASVTFEIPTSMLTGTWLVSTGAESKAIKVEKYKRPTFEVEIDKVEVAYNAGDTLEVSGTARSFVGTPIQNAKVKYRVRRTALPWCARWWGAEEETMLLADSATTDDKGRFIMRMPMLLPETKHPARLYYDINAVADVTNMAGETHQGTLTLPLSNVATIFTCDLPNKNLADSLQAMTFGYMNIAKEKIEGNVTYTIDGKEYSAQANNKIDLKGLKLKSGLHKLHAVCGTDTLDRDFIVFTLHDKKAPIETHDWFYQSSDTFPTTIQVGNTDEEHYIYYNVLTNEKVIDKGVVEGHDCLHTQTLNYKPEYGDGITISMAWVNNGKMYSHTATVKRPQPDKTLNMEWTSFRDKLTPGQDERWTLKITNNEGKAADAQLMATIYDKSLDAIHNHSLNKICEDTRNLFRFYLPSTSWYGGSNITIGLYGYQDFKMLPIKNIQLSHFDDNCFIFSYRHPYFMRLSKNMRIGAMTMADAAPMAKESAVLAKNAVGDMASTDELSGTIAGLEVKVGAGGALNDGADNFDSSQIRENFAETAYFAPALTTDKDGSVTLSFTLPESATTWRVLALAHDKLMNSGSIEAEAIASKKVMVQPNMPRFVRQGDKAVVSSMITNTTQSELKGTIRVEISEAETGKIVARQNKTFTLAAEGSTSVDFDEELPEGLYVCKIMASGKGFTDGEQHYLPVLSDKEMVTNTLPFTQTEPGTMTIDLGKLAPSKAASNKIIVEYTNNPAWLVMQALPTVSDYSSKNALSLAAAYYATIASKSIIAGCPELKEALDSWKADSISLLSDLERNEDLKSIIMSESPWLAEANNEAGQKMLLTNYYNKNNLAYKLRSIANQIAELQNGDGSFSWYKGMYGNYYITTSVATLMARMAAFGQLESKAESMLNKAMGYLQKETDKRVAEIKKEKNPQISNAELDYLYLCAIYPDGTKNGNTIKYLKSLLAKADRKTSIRNKAVAAIVFGKDNNIAREYVESIKQFTVSKPDMGRYFDTPRASYSWRDYRIPTQVAAIEAIREITPDDKTTISEMQLWLLQQKRTQAWDTPITSVDAIHTFLTGNQKALATKEQTTISLDNKPIAMPEATAKIGYVKTTVEDAKAKTIAFNKTSEGTSWGAVYSQALVPSSEISNSASGIKVERSLNVDAKTLKVGDKVTMKITITADRDYDFVQVSDQRAACLEPVAQLSGYRNGYYIAPQDNCTNYFFDRLSKGKHVIETEYYVVRQGVYSSGSCTAECAYSPAFAGRARPMIMNVGEK